MQLAFQLQALKTSLLKDVFKSGNQHQAYTLKTKL